MRSTLGKIALAIVIALVAWQVAMAWTRRKLKSSTAGSLVGRARARSSTFVNDRAGAPKTQTGSKGVAQERQAAKARAAAAAISTPTISERAEGGVNASASGLLEAAMQSDLLSDVDADSDIGSSADPEPELDLAPPAEPALSELNALQLAPGTELDTDPEESAEPSTDQEPDLDIEVTIATESLPEPVETDELEPEAGADDAEVVVASEVTVETEIVDLEADYITSLASSDSVEGDESAPPEPSEVEIDLLKNRPSSAMPIEPGIGRFRALRASKRRASDLSDSESRRLPAGLFEAEEFYAPVGVPIAAPLFAVSAIVCGIPALLRPLEASAPVFGGIAALFTVLAWWVLRRNRG